MYTYITGIIQMLQPFIMYTNTEYSAIIVQSPCILLFPLSFLFDPLSFPFTYLEPSLLW